jgi:hypothetical protein
MQRSINSGGAAVLDATNDDGGARICISLDLILHILLLLSCRCIVADCCSEIEYKNKRNRFDALYTSSASPMNEGI